MARRTQLPRYQQQRRLRSHGLLQDIHPARRALRPPLPPHGQTLARQPDQCLKNKEVRTKPHVSSLVVAATAAEQAAGNQMGARSKVLLCALRQCLEHRAVTEVHQHQGPTMEVELLPGNGPPVRRLEWPPQHHATTARLSLRHPCRAKLELAELAPRVQTQGTGVTSLLRTKLLQYSRDPDRLRKMV